MGPADPHLVYQATELLGSALDADCPNVDLWSCRELAYRLCVAQAVGRAETGDVLSLASMAYDALLRNGRAVRLGGMRPPGNRFRAILDQVLSDLRSPLVRRGAELLRTAAIATT